MDMVELLWVPLSLIVGGASALALAFASVRGAPQPQASEAAAWDEDLAA